MAISTNPKPTIYRDLYENMGAVVSHTQSSDMSTAGWERFSISCPPHPHPIPTPSTVSFFQGDISDYRVRDDQPILKIAFIYVSPHQVSLRCLVLYGWRHIDGATVISNTASFADTKLNAKFCPAMRGSKLLVIRSPCFLKIKGGGGTF